MEIAGASATTNDETISSGKKRYHYEISNETTDLSSNISLSPVGTNINN
jgi:hypothetical protein